MTSLTSKSLGISYHQIKSGKWNSQMQLPTPVGIDIVIAPGLIVIVPDLIVIAPGLIAGDIAKDITGGEIAIIGLTGGHLAIGGLMEEIITGHIGVRGTSGDLAARGAHIGGSPLMFELEVGLDIADAVMVDLDIADAVMVDLDLADAVLDIAAEAMDLSLAAAM